MRGAVVKRGKTYSFVLPLERDPETGRKRQKWVGGFTTKRACEAALAEALGRVQAGTFAADSGRMTVAEYAKDWLAAIESTIRPSTFHSYSLVMNSYVVPQLGRLRLSGLTPAQLGRFYAELGSSGGKRGGSLSPTTVRYAHTVLGKALQDAVGWGLVARNVSRAARPPRKATPHMTVWSPAEARRVVELVRDDRLYALWFLLLATGLRRGEAVGLRWADIDLEGGVLSVSRAIASVEGVAMEVEPKTARGRRAIALDLQRLMHCAGTGSVKLPSGSWSAMVGPNRARSSPIRTGGRCTLTTSQLRVLHRGLVGVRPSSTTPLRGRQTIYIG